jgi:penicillin-binding protein 1A
VKNFRVPDTIEFHPINKKDGLLLPEDSEATYFEVFAPGTAPTQLSGEKKLKARDFFRLDMEETL